jgi:hypothetical protein
MLIIIAVRKVNVAPKNMDQKTTAQKVTTWVTNNFFNSVVLNPFLSSRHTNFEKDGKRPKFIHLKMSKHLTVIAVGIEFCNIMYIDSFHSSY